MSNHSIVICFFPSRNLGSRVIEYNWTDFGYKFEVSPRINEVWPLMS